jgi:hypothetical protein
LAHQIENPLQSLTTILFLAATGDTGPDGKMAAESADPDLQVLSNLVKRLLALPTGFNAGGGKDPAMRSSGKRLRRTQIVPGLTGNPEADSVVPAKSHFR